MQEIVSVLREKKSMLINLARFFFWNESEAKPCSDKQKLRKFVEIKLCLNTYDSFIFMNKTHIYKHTHILKIGWVHKEKNYQTLSSTLSNHQATNADN